MISKKMQQALNDQINAEFASAYLYLSMSAFYTAENLPGFAHWMKVQFKEEMDHARRIFDFVTDRCGRVALQALAAPPEKWKSASEPFSEAYKHEVEISGKINNLMSLAVAEKDYATGAFLNWFVTEQVEEEKQADEIVKQLAMAGESKGTLLVIDHHLGKREG